MTTQGGRRLSKKVACRGIGWVTPYRGETLFASESYTVR